MSFDAFDNAQPVLLPIGEPIPAISLRVGQKVTIASQALPTDKTWINPTWGIVDGAVLSIVTSGTSAVVTGLAAGGTYVTAQVGTTTSKVWVDVLSDTPTKIILSVGVPG